MSCKVASRSHVVPKDRQLPVRFTEKQIAALERWAELLDCSKGEVVRMLVDSLDYIEPTEKIRGNLKALDAAAIDFVIRQGPAKNEK